MTDTPLFSLIMANYNSRKFLDFCIQSVEKQTYSNWEIVAVDDFSTDGSYEMLLDYAKKDPRIKVFRNDRNHGLGYTRHQSASFAKGEFCACLDPDDAIVPNAVELMADELQKHPEASLIGSRRLICNEKMRLIDVDAPLTKERVASFKNELETPWIINHFAGWRKSCYDKTEGFDPIMLRSTDTDLYLKLEETGKVLFLDKPLYLYRKNKNSVSLNKNIHKTHLWHIYTATNACKRRGLNIDNYSFLVTSDGHGLKKAAKKTYRFFNSIKSVLRGRIHIIKYRRNERFVINK